MASKTVSVTIPDELFESVEAVRRRGQRSRSSIVREAIRDYLSRRRVPVVEATPEELAELEDARREVERGEFVSLAELRDDLGLNP